MRIALRNPDVRSGADRWHATWIVLVAMITRIDRRAYKIPAPHLSGALPKVGSGSNPALQTASLVAIPVPRESSRTSKTLQTRSRGIGAVLRFVLRMMSVPVKTPHLAALRFFMFGTFTGLSIACALILAIRAPEEPAKRKTAVSETNGARTLVVLRPPIAFERAHGSQMAKAPPTPPRITTTTSAAPAPATGKRVAQVRPTTTNLFAAALSP
jgi:hypothetical protein